MRRKYLIPTEDLVHVARGILMGGADIIPGVSGGTVALILGIYQRLVKAVSHFDLTLLQFVRQRNWSAAARHIDLRFLVALGCGVVGGIAGLASLMHYLLEHHRQPTYAAFFGLILASCVLVAGAVRGWPLYRVLALLGGAVAAFWLVGLPFLQSPPPGNAYVFFSGAVAICAMILPGISGAFILLILGKYEEVTQLLRDLLRLDFSVEAVVTVAVFVAGCVVGLLSFSKILRWLLGRHEMTTLAVLCGVMAGSLRKIWPFKQDLTPEVAEPKRKLYENIWPDLGDGQVWLAILIAIAAAALVFGLDWLTRKKAGGRKHAAK
jgi:putative membrane protein